MTLERRTGLRAVSRKRQKERPERDAVRAAVKARDRSCRAWGRAPGQCGTLPGRYALEVHEVEGRGRHPGSHLDIDLCIAICPVHHEWVGANVARATALGLLAHAG